MTDKIEYTEEERRQARIILGFRNPDWSIIPLEDRTPENLLQMVRNYQDKVADSLAAHQAAMNVMEDRLKTARKAKRLANRRADKAEKAMRALLDAFGETKVK